ncbi:MAG TPA: hypothetical protein VJR27_01775 [Candidatus Saccharimonadales bacterium]|nr:hypothetical protein [Candidatus Saccharimonadales bacterium]
MKQPGFEFSGSGERPGDLVVTPTIFDEKLDMMVDRFGLSVDIANAYRSDDAFLYSTGFSELDQQFAQDMAKAKEDTLNTFIERYNTIYENNLVEPEEAEILQNEAANRAMRRGAAQSKIATLAMGTGETWTIERNSEWVKHLEDTQDYGLERSWVVYRASKANILNYYHVLNMRPEERNCAITEYAPPGHGSIYASLFRNEETELPLTVEAVEDKLQQLGYSNLTKENLDARADNFYALAQLEGANLFLEGTITLAKFGGRRRSHALMLARKYRDVLTVNDYEGKVEMMSELAKSFTHYAAYEHNGQSKHVLKLLGKHAKQTEADMVGMLEGFKPVYERLGYEVPTFLRFDEPSIPPTVQEQVETLVTNNANASSLELEMLLLEVAEENVKLHQDAQAFNDYWRLTAKQRREAGFDSMQHELVKGFVNYAGDQLLPALSKENAVQVIGVLARLDQITRSEDTLEGKEKLNALVAHQKSLEEHRQLLRMFVVEKQIQGVILPDIKAVDRFILDFQNNWTTTRQLILKTWPAYEGRIVVENMERLLFEVPQPVQDDAKTQEALELQGNIAEQLDKIILPPEATQRDLDQELQRVGASKVTSLEWQRLTDLINIRKQYDGTLFRSKEGSLGSTPPYFVVVIQLGGETYAIAESPVFGNATYVIAEKHAAGSWLEVLELSKSTAREVGAHKIVHAKKGKSSLKHIDKIYDKILSLHLMKAE